MELTENMRYIAAVDRLVGTFPYWEMLDGKTLFLSGATGMIGSFLVDTVMRRNETAKARCHIVAAGRSRLAMERRFAGWRLTGMLDFVEQDITVPLQPLPRQPDYWIHAASIVHPVGYATQPVDTILGNVLGTYHILENVRKSSGRFLFMSSVDIYGENRGDMEYFAEDYCGYLNCNTLRADYFESKRLSEAMCQAYIAQYQADAVIVRLPRCYGPTMKWEDTKAVSQFIKNGVQGEDIVLKSAGDQHYSFAFVSDAVKGLLWVLLRGETGQAYNVSDSRSDITQRELAQRIARCAGKQVVFQLPDAMEQKGYSPAMKALLDSSKLRALGWSADYDIAEGIRETVGILRELGRS